MEGVRLWVDGTLAYADAGLKWSENGEYATRIVIGADVRTTPTKLEGLVVEGTPTLVEGSVPNPAPRLTASAGSFTAPGANLDNSVTIAAAPISLNGVSATSFTAIIDAELPEGATGTLFGWKAGDNNVHVHFDTNRLYLAYGGDTDYASSNLLPAVGRHRWVLTYNDNDTGSTLYQDDALLASSSGLKWSKQNVTQVNVGDAVATDATPLTGLKVYAVHVTMGSATPPENTMTALYDVPEALAGVGEAALYHLMTQNGRVGDFTVPAVTLNGETLGAADAARALWLFDKTGPFAADTSITLTWGIADLSVAGDTITLIPGGDTLQNGVLSVLEKAALNETWQRVEATPTDRGAFTLPLGDGATAFYTIRAEEEEQALGPVVTLDPTPAAEAGMPSQVLPPTDGTSAAKAALFNFNLDGAFDDLGEAQRSSLTLTLEGDGLVPGGEYTLTVDGTSHTATLEAPAAAQRRLARANGYALPHTVGTLVFTGFTLTETSTVSLSGPAVAGQITVTESSWGLAGQSARVAATLADDLVKDGFVPEDNTLEMMSYRIPALATDGQGGVLAVYDIRYGSGDLGSGELNSQTSPLTGIDLGENFSSDGGTTWTKPRLGIDVPNFRNPDGGFPNGSDKSAITREMDLGDASILFDPATQKYWLIAMTGGGLHCGYRNTDCVLYSRGMDDNATWGNRTSVKETIATALETDYGVTIVKTGSNNHNGFLGGPGHGIVTRVGRGEMPAGTLVFPIQCFVNNNTGAAQCAALYSTDQGTTWNVTGLTPRTLAQAPHNAQENCIMELDDGSWLMMSKGGNWDQGRRLFFRTTDFKTWKQLDSINNVIHVQGSCLRIGEVGGVSRYVMAHQIDPSSRCKLALIFGTDITKDNPDASQEGVDWNLENPVMIFQGDTGNKGYVSLCLIDETTLGILYEANGKIYFERFDLTPYLR